MKSLGHNQVSNGDSEAVRKLKNHLVPSHSSQLGNITYIQFSAHTGVNGLEQFAFRQQFSAFKKQLSNTGCVF